MKKARVIGAAALVLAVLVAVVGVFSMKMQPGEGDMGALLAEAQAVQTTMNGNDKAVRTINSATKKAENAVKSAETAVTETEEAVAKVAELKELVAGMTTGEAQLDLLMQSAQRTGEDVTAANAAMAEFETAVAGVLGDETAAGIAMDALKTAVNDLTSTTADVQSVVDGMVMELFAAAVDPAAEAVVKAEENINAALAAAQSIYTAMADETAVPAATTVTEAVAYATIEEAEAAAAAYAERALQLPALAEESETAVTASAAAANAAVAGTHMTVAQKVVLALKNNTVAVLFTAGLLAVIGAALLCFAKQLLNLWTKNAVFPVFVVLLGMLVFQTYALGFDQPSFGEWATFWLNNNFNVLRANTSVGIIALGMTLVIITGGIDLAVGSTVAGVGTVMMVLMDTSSHGILYNMGITGLPLYVIGIAGGILTGLLLGAFTGLAVTKGGVPPFIVTLGTMNIVRSVAQYFTQSYNPKVPEGFTAMANTVIGGQRILPIVYWLVLVVIIHVISKHTAFGRHIYAVGSNERTTKLSGINVHNVKIKVYVLMGLLVSIASAIQLSRMGGMDVASAGSGYEMDAIAATVVGGTSMAGGRGSIIGTVLGVLIIGLMNNLLILLGVDSFLTNAFKGAIVLLAVLMQRKEKAA